MKYAKCAILAVTSIILFGCNEEEVKTKDYYKENEAERIKVLSRCKSEGEKSDDGYTTNCMNARMAQNVIDAQKPWPDVFGFKKE